MKRHTGVLLALRNGVNIRRPRTTAGERSKIDQRLNTKKPLIQQDRSGNVVAEMREIALFSACQSRKKPRPEPMSKGAKRKPPEGGFCVRFYSYCD
jgi:hypothetical protein